jgi:hypothetical protein
MTSLEMDGRPSPGLHRLSAPAPRWASADPAKYRALFRRVGEPWLWFLAAGDG